MADIVYSREMFEHHIRGLAVTVTLDGFALADGARLVHAEVYSSRAEAF